jgi:hypothetical protein
MKGDFTRDTFDRTKHYSRVLMQQGRVQLDADWNEQAGLLLHRLETMAKDLIGYGGGPDAKAGGGFDLDLHKDDRDFVISAGRYYVEGLLVENEANVFYSSHAPDAGKSDLINNQTYLVYLDAWEDFVSAAEDAAIREIGLGGADTTGRGKVLWRVRTQAIPPLPEPPCPGLLESFPQHVAGWQGETRGRLKVRVNQSQVPSDDPCIIPPSNRYRGAENQLYRVEVHRGGTLGGSRAGVPSGPTFKWSRENGSVVYPIAPEGINGDMITVESTGRDPNLSLQVGDWVELAGGTSVASQSGATLFRVTLVDPSRNRVEVKPKPGGEFAGSGILRRWDQKGSADNKGVGQLQDGAVSIREGVGDLSWIPLENGIEVQFQRKDADPKNNYRAGDFWLIPARTAKSGQIEWPSTGDEPDAILPHGIFHRYAPLAAILFSNDAPMRCYLRKTMGSVVDIVRAIKQ